MISVYIFDCTKIARW